MTPSGRALSHAGGKTGKPTHAPVTDTTRLANAPLEIIPGVHAVTALLTVPGGPAGPAGPCTNAVLRIWLIAAPTAFRDPAATSTPRRPSTGPRTTRTPPAC